MKIGRAFGLLAIGCALAGCVTTNSMPIAPNQVMLETRAGGLLFQGQSGPQTVKKAAETTLASGYQLFKLSNTEMGSKDTLVPVSNCSWGQYGGGCSSGAMPHQSERVSTVVTMFHPGDPGSQGAFDAAQVLGQQGGS